MTLLPLISVIVPVFNVEKYLHECVDSILAQTYHHFELVLINDGSSDSSGAICDQYRTQDHRIRVIHKANTGVSETRNVGIRSAIGKYLVFVDSDDYIHPEMIEMMCEAIIRTKADIVVSGFAYCFNDRKLMQIPQNSGLFHFDNDFNLFFSDLYPINTLSGPCNKMFRKDILCENNIYFLGEYSICEDGIFSYTYLLNCKSIYIISQPLYFYRIREGEDHLMSKYHENAFEALNEYYQTVNEFMNKFNASEKNRNEVNISFSSRYLLFLRELYAHKLDKDDLYNELLKQNRKYYDVFINNSPISRYKYKEAALILLLKLKLFKPFHYLMKYNYRYKHKRTGK